MTTHSSRLLLSLFTASLVLAIGTTSVHAQPISTQDCIDAMGAEIPQNVCKNNNEHFSTMVIEGICQGAGCATTAVATTNPDGTISYKQEIIQKGAIATTNELITYALTTPPVHTATYVADLLHNSGLVSQAYAQGLGFSGLTPVLKIWKGFRNIAYFLFIVVFVVIGFMVMLRKKISSNTVVTIQEALPKLILTLILITFSYAIAGLVIDLIYLSIYVMLNIFEQMEIITDAQQTQNVIFGRNIIAVGWKYLMGSVNSGGVGFGGAAALNSLVSKALGGVWGSLTAGLGYLVIIIAVLIALFRTLFTLIVAYVSIVLSVIFAPIQLLMNAFPGSDAFNKWLRGLIANAAVFPAAVAMIVIGAALAGHGAVSDFGISSSTDSTGGFMPPLIGLNGSGAGGATEAIGSIIGLGMIMLLPEVTKLVKQGLEVKDDGLGDMVKKNVEAGDFIGGTGKLLGGVMLQGAYQAAGSAIAKRLAGGEAEHRANQRLAGLTEEETEARLEGLAPPVPGSTRPQSTTTPPTIRKTKLN